MTVAVGTVGGGRGVTLLLAAAAAFAATVLVHMEDWRIAIGASQGLGASGQLTYVLSVSHCCRKFPAEICQNGIVIFRSNGRLSDQLGKNKRKSNATQSSLVDLLHAAH